MEIALLILGAIIGWAANQLLPVAWRKISRQPDLDVHVETDPALIWAGAPPWVGKGFMVELTPSIGTSLSPPSSFCPDWWHWARAELGAVDADQTEVRLIFTATRDTTVVIDGFRARVLRREGPLPWTHPLCGAGGADIIPRHAQIDLELFDPPTTQFEDPSGEPIGMPVLSIPKGEAETFYVLANAPTSYIEWEAEALLIVEGRRRSIRITDNGKPFRTSGSCDRPTHLWVDDQWDPPLC